MSSKPSTSSYCEKPLISENILNQLKCSICALCLSVPPINLVNSKSYVCGRCTNKIPSKSATVRIKVFEILAQQLLFPCQYDKRGCRKTLNWGSVLGHENTCKFRGYDCPVLPPGSCRWTGFMNQLHGHFSKQHKNLLLNSSVVFQPGLKKNSEENRLVSINNQLYLLQMVVDKSVGKFWVTMRGIDEKENSSRNAYLLELKNAEDVNSFYIWYDVKNITVGKWAIQKDIMQVFDINELKVTLNASNIACKITIHESSAISTLREPQNQQKAPKSPQNLPSDNDLLIDLECPVCQEYMIPPIFICSAGHSICGECTAKIRTCPICSAPLASTRNFTLEKLTTNVRYPCKNSNIGCQFIGSSTNIRMHEAECKFSGMECPLKEAENCSWRGNLKYLSTHVTKKHPSHKALLALVESQRL